VPPSADTIVMVEHTEERSGFFVIEAAQEKGAHILRRGEDARKGTVLLHRGIRLGAAEVGVCAAVGKPKVNVFRRPRVAVICTGSELRGAGDRVKAHEIRDSNGPAVCAALADWGFPEVDFSLVADRKEELTQALRRALKRHDAVLFTGGVSAGAYDFVPDAVNAVGATIRFRGLRMRPGKPTLYATAQDNRHIFGLPGNPLSVFTALHEFALPALRQLAGFDARQCRVAYGLPLAEEIQSAGGWTFFKLAKLNVAPGGVSVAAVASASSADLASAAHADGVIAVPPDRTKLVAGEIVSFLPWRPLP
jgi:molybdopterin molybdotransferase